MFVLKPLLSIRTAALLLLALLAAPPPRAASAAESSIEREIEQHATLGRRHAEKARYHDAILEYRKAYELRADPEFLFAIAGCYRRLGNSERALFFYQRYLSAAPAGANRAAAEQEIAVLGTRTLAPSDTTQEPEAEPPLPPAALAPSLAHDVVLVELPAHPRTERPLLRHWWLWASIGAVVVGATVAVVATRHTGEPSPPATALGNMRY